MATKTATKTPPSSRKVRRTQADGGAVGSGSDTKDSILREAALAFKEHGFDGTSIDHVAERLGSTKGRIYHHFESKSDLFLEVQRWALEGLLNEVTPLAQAKQSVPKRLRAMVHTHTTMIATGYGFEAAGISGREVGLLKVTSARQHKLLRHVFELRDRYEDLFAGILDQGIQAGDFEPVPARLLTKPLFGSVNWLLIWYDPERASGLTIAQLADLHADFVLRAVSRQK